MMGSDDTMRWKTMTSLTPKKLVSSDVHLHKSQHINKNGPGIPIEGDQLTGTQNRFLVLLQKCFKREVK